MAAGFDITSMADGIGTLMTAGATILVAIVGRNGRIAPPIPEWALFYRLACLITVLTAILIRFSGIATMADDELFTILLWWFIAAVAVMLLYLVGRMALTIRCDDDPKVHLAGIWKTAVAKGRLGKPGEPPDARNYFCGNNRNAAAIWSPASRLLSGLILSLLYAALIATATAALSVGWLLASREPPPISQSPPPNVIILPADLLFEFDSAELSQSAASRLSAVAARLRAEHAVRIIIGGHTDSRGTDQSNLLLSERRASAVYQWLIGPGCLDPARITARGHGASQPIAPNVNADSSDYPEGRARNRRVELRYELAPDGQAEPTVAHCPAS